jgi:putative copper resistance protein D
MDAVSFLQVGSAMLLNAGFAWLVGSWFARCWMRASGGDRNRFEPALRKLDLWASGLSALSSTLALLVATAVMGGVGLREACPMFWMMVSNTDYGHAGTLAVMAMSVVFLIRLVGSTRRTLDAVALLALAIFAVTRASMGHAGEEGLWTLTLAAEAIHFSAIGVWTGAVLVSAWYALQTSAIGFLGTHSTNRYLDLMSRAAMAAVIAIVITGVYSGWHRVGTPDHLAHTSYGITLLVKVVLVLAAIALGGYNKYFGLPAASRSVAGVSLARTVLQVESFVLLAVLLAAAILTAQQPPAAM